jgi:hypothetical protein
MSDNASPEHSDYFVVIKSSVSGCRNEPAKSTGLEKIHYNQITFTSTEWKKMVAFAPGIVAWACNDGWNTEELKNVPGFSGKVFKHTMHLDYSTGLSLEEIAEAKMIAVTGEAWTMYDLRVEHFLRFVGSKDLPFESSCAKRQRAE